MEYVFSLIMGISLSATSGFRVFVPLALLSLAAQIGWVELSPAFDWIASRPAFAALLIATILELIAYYIPYVDNLLGLAATPVKIMAGVLITASLLVNLDPMLTWTLAVIAGGGAALGGSAVSNTIHAGSTATTGGVANPLLSLAETIFSFLMAIIAILVPLLALALLVLTAIILTRLFRSIRKRRSGKVI